MTREEYLIDPCRVSSIPFWKIEKYPVPPNMKIVHEKDYRKEYSKTYVDTKYFRLIHRLEEIANIDLKDNWSIKCVDTRQELEAVVEIINKCYKDIQVNSNQVKEWMKGSVFEEALWLFIVDQKEMKPIALGIAEWDREVNEGALEWIQVLPEYRGCGIGKVLVLELLNRMKWKVDFVTVSGQIDNETKPERLYRQCGFVGEDIWHIMRER